MEENIIKQEIEIKTITKWKRILIYLGDFFINFMLSFLLFGVLVAPIGKTITGYDTKSKEYEISKQEKIDILYGNKLIFIDDENYKYVHNSYMSYTYNLFLSYYVIDGSEDFILKDDKYGHNSENEIFQHYYFDIRNDKDSYYNLFNKYNKVGYFNVEENNIYLLDEYKELLKDQFNKNSELSNEGKELYDDIASSLFFAIYAEILTDIQEKDLSFNGISKSYNQLETIASNIENYHKNLLSISSIISLILSSSVIYIIYPMINKNRRTITMSILKYNRINIKTFNKVNRNIILLKSLYDFISNLFIPIFLPITLVSYAYIFTYSILLTLFLIGGIYIIFSFITLLFDPFARTIEDKITSSVLIHENELFEIYKYKGYVLKDGTN